MAIKVRISDTDPNIPAQGSLDQNRLIVTKKDRNHGESCPKNVIFGILTKIDWSLYPKTWKKCQNQHKILSKKDIKKNQFSNF